MEGLVAAYKNGGTLNLNGYDNALPKELFHLQAKDKEYIAKSIDGFLVAINTEITPELKAEGMYREILRHCQLLRKEAGFALSDRVTLGFDTKSLTVQSVIETYKTEMARETLSDIKSIEVPLMQKEIMLDDKKLVIFIA